MSNSIPEKAQAILNERFGCDQLLSLATLDGDWPAVRTVNGYYEDGCFFVITYGLSNKMKQIEKNPMWPFPENGLRPRESEKTLDGLTGRKRGLRQKTPGSFCFVD